MVTFLSEFPTIAKKLETLNLSLGRMTHMDRKEARWNEAAMNQAKRKADMGTRAVRQLPNPAGIRLNTQTRPIIAGKTPAYSLYEIGLITPRALSVLLFLALLTLGAASGRSDPVAFPQPSYRSRLEDRVRSYLQPYLMSRNFSGVVLLARGDEVLLHHGYGMADYERSLPNLVHTPFPIASLSKTFTAAAIWKLQEQGILHLDVTIDRFLPDFPNGDLITVKHLIDHTSGLPRMVFFPDYAQRSRMHHTARDLVDWIRDKPLAFSVGQRYGYSNSNYALLARIIEIASDQDYDEYLQENIFDIYQLKNTGHLKDVSEIVPGLAYGYTPEGTSDLTRARFHDYSIATGSGSIYSTAEDLLKWFTALQSGEVVKQSFLEHIWIEDKLLGREVLRKNGWDGVGFAARWVYLLQEDVTIIVLGNLNISTVLTEIAENLSSIVLDGTFNPLVLKPTSPVNSSLLHRNVGTYQFGPDFYVPNARMRVVFNEGQLFIEDRPGVRSDLLPLSDSEFIHRTQWFRVRFQENDDGQIWIMKYGPFDARREAMN